MSESKHTPGPWVTRWAPASQCWCVEAGDAVIGYFKAIGDAERAAACANACEGIKNPAALPGVLEALEALAFDADVWGEVERIPEADIDRLQAANDALAKLNEAPE